MQPLTLAPWVAEGQTCTSAAHQDGMQLDELAVLGLIGEVFTLAVDGGEPELHLRQARETNQVQDGGPLRTLDLHDV